MRYTALIIVAILLNGSIYGQCSDAEFNWSTYPQGSTAVYQTLAIPLSTGLTMTWTTTENGNQNWQNTCAVQTPAYKDTDSHPCINPQYGLVWSVDWENTTSSVKGTMTFSSAILDPELTVWDINRNAAGAGFTSMLFTDIVEVIGYNGAIEVSPTYTQTVPDGQIMSYSGNKLIAVGKPEGGFSGVNYSFSGNITMIEIVYKSAPEVSSNNAGPTTNPRQQHIVIGKVCWSICSPLTNPGVIAADQTICAGNIPDPLTSVSEASGGSSTTAEYQWESSTAGSNIGFSEINGATAVGYSPGALTQTTWYRRKARKCDGAWEETSDVVQITVNPAPALVVTANEPAFCTGGSTGITASGADGYTWDPGTGLSATTGSSVTANPSTSTTYTVTGTDANGCTNTATVAITVHSPPNVNANSSSASLCDGESATLTATGASNYTWAPNTNLSATTGSSVTANPSTSITYTVTGTDANGCTNTATVSITIAPTLTIDITAAPPSVCEGSSTVITATGAANYTWSPGTGLSATTGSSVTASPSTNITYTVTGTTGSCTGSSTVSLTVNTPPTVNASTSSASLCDGESATLTATGASNYTWAPNTNLSATSGSSVTANPSTSTTYTVTGTDANGCTNTATVSITIAPALTIELTAAPPSVCVGSSTVITATGAADYVWSPGTALSATTGSSVTASPSVNTTYTVTGTTGACTGTATVSITISNNSIHNLQFTICNGDSLFLENEWQTTAGTYTDTYTGANGCDSIVVSELFVETDLIITSPTLVHNVCEGGTISLQISSINGATYIWTGPNSFSSNQQNPQLNNITTAMQGTYSVYAVLGACTSNTVQITVNVEATPAAPTLTSNSPVCIGQSIELTASGATGATYQWTGPGGFSSTQQNPVIPNANASHAGTYTVYATINSCSGASASVQVVVNSPPTVNAGPNLSICSGDIANVQASASNYTSLTWTTSGSGSFTNASTLEPTYTPSAQDIADGSIYLYLTITSPCGTITDSTLVTVYGLPLVDAGDDVEIFAGESVTLTASGGLNYVWLPDVNLTCTQCQTTTASPLETTTYYVTVSDGNGCWAVDSVIVSVIHAENYFIPRAFSPNNDNENDVLYVYGTGIKQLSFSIYDRWGQVVFKTSDKSLGWDGTYKGKPLDPGVFVWTADIIFYNNVRIQDKGNITLVR